MALRFCFLALACAAAGCGGGGSDDEGGGGGTPTAPPFNLTEFTALEAGSYALGAAEEALLGAVTATVVSLNLSQPAPRPENFCGGQPITETYDDRDGSGTVTVGDVIRFQHAECFGLARNYSLTLSAFDPPAGAYAGRLDLTTSLGPLQMTGGLTLSVDVTAATIRVRTSNLSLTLTTSGTRQVVRATTNDISVTQTSYDWSMTGGSVDSAALGGSYTFQTGTPLTGKLRRLPSAGTVMLATAAGSRVSISPPSAPVLGEATVDYVVAAPGGGYAPARQGLWPTLLRGWLFEWQPNTPPVISNLTIEPTLPAAGTLVSVHYDASDPDGDPLTIEVSWRINGQPVGGNSSLLAAATSRNDLVEVTVSVSDGREQSPTRRSAAVTIGNRAPILSSMSITPEFPDTASDLVAVANVLDPDGDPLQATYVWYRNQTVINGQTSAVLPASTTTRGETYLVTATFQDDGLSVTGSASATIQDAAPRVAVAAPPTTVTHGMPTGFTATVSDADGDPVNQLRFELAYGPAGMTVDPVTGAVVWTPSGPMFDRTLDVNWSVTVGILGAQAATGTIRVDDPARDYPLLRTGVQVPLRNSLRVGDFDADGDSEMMLLGTRTLFEVESDGAGGYRQSWAYPFLFDAADVVSDYGDRRAMVTGDVDGDGRHEIFVATANRLIKLDGDERRVVASVSVGTFERCEDLEYGDLDRDGSPEIVCAAVNGNGSERVVVYGAADFSERSSLASIPVGTLALGNVDTDAALEIVTSSGYVIDGASASVQWHHAPGFAAVATGNIDGSGADEIVAQTAYTELAAFRAGNPTPFVTIANVAPDTLFVADIGGDARAEILSGDNQWGNVTAYRYDPGTGTADIVFQLDSQNHGVTAFAVAEFDGDSPLEIAWGSGLTSGAGQLVVTEYPGSQVEWATADPDRLMGPFVGGALARSPISSPAPLFVTLSAEDLGWLGSRLVRLAPDDGTIEVSPELDAARGNIFSTLAVADYDADGTDEALLAGTDPFTATPTAYDFYTDTPEWTPAQAQSARQLLSGNVYGDPRHELVWLGADGSIYVLDVATRQLIWQSDALSDAFGLRLADLDGNGYAEIISNSFVTIVTFERSPAQPFQMGALFQSSLHIIDVTAGDTDGDGEAEIFALLNQGSPTVPARVVQFDTRLRLERDFSILWLGRSIALEASPFARKNLLVSYREGASGRLATIDARNGGIVSESPPLLGAVKRDSLHYVELGLGPPRLSFGTDFGMYLSR